MELTRGNVIDRVANTLGDTSTSFRTHLETSFNEMMDVLWDLHDWNWKHKSATFSTVSGTEEYDLSSTLIVSGLGDLRSSTDIEVMYDKTNGRFLLSHDLREFRKRYPKEDQSGQPTHRAPWGAKSVFLNPKPNGVFSMKFLYITKATYPADILSPPPNLDNVTLEANLGIPSYIHYLFEKLVLAEGMLFYDDSRRTALLNEITTLWLRNAVTADMKQLETTARFKFWEEELASSGLTFDDFLRRTWATPQC